MLNRELFAHHMQHVLASFYSTAVLQASPLASALGLPREQGDMTAQALRQLLREAIETLKPSLSLPFSAPEWLDYRLLWTRYIHARSVVQTCRDLAISSSTFYRHHHRALETVANSLWERHVQPSEGQPASVDAARLAAVPDYLSEEATRLLQASRPRPIDPEELLREGRETLLPLLRQESVALRISAVPDLPMIYCDPTVLSQILLSVLGEAIDRADGHTLELEVSASDRDTIWRVGWLGESESASLNTEGGALALAKLLLVAYDSRLEFAHDGRGRTAVLFRLPFAKPKIVQVIDDDVDATRLYRSYLQNPSYLVREAHNSEELTLQFAEAPPDLLLLDVLMPERDGWSILRQLKSNPVTERLPIIVCSVLSQPRLALALGATRVLQKPISKEALVQAVRELLSQADSQARATPRAL